MKDMKLNRRNTTTKSGFPKPSNKLYSVSLALNIRTKNETNVNTRAKIPTMSHCVDFFSFTTFLYPFFIHSNV